MIDIHAISLYILIIWCRCTGAHEKTTHFEDLRFALSASNHFFRILLGQMASCVKPPWGASSFRTLHGGVKRGGLEKQPCSSRKDPIVDALPKPWD